MLFNLMSRKKPYHNLNIYIVYCFIINFLERKNHVKITLKKSKKIIVRKLRKKQ